MVEHWRCFRISECFFRFFSTSCASALITLFFSSDFCLMPVLLLNTRASRRGNVANNDDLLLLRSSRQTPSMKSTHTHYHHYYARHFTFIFILSFVHQFLVRIGLDKLIIINTRGESAKKKTRKERKKECMSTV